ncbi:MAG: hypothetical protein KKA63_03945 [Gammaproteobacteria bacterium]|nr:hypothetical protein [Gammaproteobacteria bacterium]MDD2928950.1 hypothetical protein [Sideroxydans sp.]MDD5470931.1 hypothetical protein [Sideroxydans sp.]
MNNHIELLMEIILNPRPEAQVLEALNNYGTNADGYLAYVSRASFISILHQFKQRELCATDLKAWATRMLERHDIGFEFGEEGALEEAVFQLAHDEIYGKPDDLLCQHIEAMLERRGPDRTPQ